MNKNKFLLWLYFVIIFLAVLFPRLLDLDQYVTTDEPLWLHRSANFYYALAQREFEYTYQDKHPGVTIMWAGTAGFLVDYPEYRGMGQGYFDPLGFDSYLDKIGKEPLELLVAGRIFVVLGAAITFAIAFLITSQLIGTFPALIGFLLIAFDPFIIALNTILHPDALLPSMMLLSAVAYLAYLNKDRKWFYLLISAVAAAWSWMTKYPGLFLIPYVGLATIIYVVRERNRWKDGIKRIISPLLWWLLISCIVFMVFWPAMWVAPLQTLSSIFNAFNSGFLSNGGMPILHNGEIVSSADIMPSYYPINYLWHSTPAVLFGIALAIISMTVFFKKHSREGEIIIMLILFSFFYMLGISLGSHKANRYIGPIFPILTLAAGIGWVIGIKELIHYLKAKYKFAFIKGLQVLFVGALILAQILVVFQTRPYYWAYGNPMLGGTRKAVEIVNVGYGEGLDQAAAYLETIPNASELTVLSWYGTGPVSYYFSGEVQNMLLRSNWGYSNAKRIMVSDYVVIYVNQWQRGMMQELTDVLGKIKPEYTVVINGADYAKIYKVSDIPQEDYDKLLEVKE